jgi:hypothetical protein
MTQQKRGLSWRDRPAADTSEPSEDGSIGTSGPEGTHLADEFFFAIEDPVADLLGSNQATFSTAPGWEAELPRLPGHIQHAADQVDEHLKETVMRQVRLDPSVLQGWTILLPQLGVGTITNSGLAKKSSVTYLIDLAFEGRLQKVPLDVKKPQSGKVKKASNSFSKIKDAKTWKRYPFKLLYPQPPQTTKR